MQCNYCGAELENNAKFCQECGKKVKNTEAKSNNMIAEVSASKFINSQKIKGWNPLWLVIFPFLWIIWQYPQIRAESIELQIAEALGGAIVILVLSLIIPTFILLFKKAKKLKYLNFIRDTFFTTFIMFIVALYAEYHHAEQIKKTEEFKKDYALALEKFQQQEKEKKEHEAKTCREYIERLDILVDILESEYKTATDNIQGSSTYYFTIYQMKQEEAKKILSDYLEAKSLCSEYMEKDSYGRNPTIEKLKNISKGYIIK